MKGRITCGEEHEPRPPPDFHHLASILWRGEEVAPLLEAESPFTFKKKRWRFQSFQIVLKETRMSLLSPLPGSISEERVPQSTNFFFCFSFKQELTIWAYQFLLSDVNVLFPRQQPCRIICKAPVSRCTILSVFPEGILIPEAFSAEVLKFFKNDSVGETPRWFCSTLIDDEI